ncbi:MAG: NAD(P)-binding domain-containing protein [Planctomycetota bacterium]|jgi:thioredoxin reductase (NADPH)
MRERTQVLIIGAGPIGLEVAWELKQRGIDYVHVDKNQIASTIGWFPEGMTFFSSSDRIGICGIPLQTPGQRKATKEEYLDYMRTVVRARDLEVRTYEEVVALEPGFVATTRRADGERRIEADAVVLATGDMAEPRTLGIPGEDLPHVSHYFEEPHRYFRRRLVVVGGKNSAVEAALRCWHADVDVTISYRRDAFPEKAVKYWLLPELKGRIHRGEIACHFRTEPVKITETHVTLRRDGTEFDVPADFVLLLTGYVADMSLFERLGAALEGAGQRPVVDANTMETTVPGLYVAGTASAGTQLGYTLFIENCHIHAVRIAAAIAGEPPPPDPPPLTLPES